jgi:type VI secretion system protein ImpH
VAEGPSLFRPTALHGSFTGQNGYELIPTRVNLDSWTRLPHGAFGGAHYQLGVDATAGARVWDPHARVTLRIGPLSLDAFEALLPGQKSLTAFAALARSYLGLSTALRINLILRTQDIPQARLAAGPSTFARLGWTSWLKRTAEPAGVNADDLAFPV